MTITTSVHLRKKMLVVSLKGLGARQTDGLQTTSHKVTLTLTHWLFSVSREYQGFGSMA
jgi:hypothetical protein